MTAPSYVPSATVGVTGAGAGAGAADALGDELGAALGAVPELEFDADNDPAGPDATAWLVGSAVES